MTINVKPIDLFNSTTVYDPNKATYVGKITTKTISGKTVVGPPIVKYRNTVTGPEALTPVEVVITDNDRIFAISAETNGLVSVALYDLAPSNGDVNYVGRINIRLPEPPSTTYAFRGVRAVDDGVTGWKLFLLTTANVAPHNGLYMVNNIDLADFTFVPILFDTATAPGQKAVYKIDNSPFNLSNGTGLSLDKANSKVYVHRGLSTAHSFIRFDYSLPIINVLTLGATTDLYEFETGNLPVLAGTLLLTNSEEYTVPQSGPNAGEPCVIFHTTSTMYRGRLSELTSGVTIWPSLEFANNLGNLGELISPTTLRATYSEAIQKVVLLGSATSFPSSIIVKDFADNTHDLVNILLSADNNEASPKEMYKFKTPQAPVGFDARRGYSVIISATTGTRGIYTASFDIDDRYDLTHIISPVLDVKNKILSRFTVGFVRQDLASPIKVYYRTSGFGTATGGWIAASDDLDLGNISSPTGQIQFKIGYKIFSNDSSNALQLYSAGIVYVDQSAISDNWEYSHDDTNPAANLVSYRLSKQYTTLVPSLRHTVRDLNGTLVANHTTSANPSFFQYSTDGGVNWLSLGTIPNLVGTLVRYTNNSLPNIELRPALQEE